MAWREADVREEGMFHPTAAFSSTGPPEDIDAPLTEATQRGISLLRVPVDRIVSDALSFQA